MNEEEARDLKVFTTNDRKALFMEMAGRPEGAAALEVYRRAIELGDTVTEEAYYNLARRLVHRGLLSPTSIDGATRYNIGAYTDSQWLEEDDLSALVDPEYPLIALTIWKESQRQINEVPEELWIELRERLRAQPARNLFFQAIASYCDDFHAQIATLAEIENHSKEELAQLRQEAENSRLLLLRLTKHGLGLSKEAVNVPMSVATAIADFKQRRFASFKDEAVLKEELKSRISEEPVILDALLESSDRNMLIGAVDGSTRGGILSFLGEEGDFGVGHAPMIAINTSIGQVNRSIQRGNRKTPVFMRLPEKPEDMQRQDNRYTVMAKLLYPDLSDAEYMHSIWNAMDLIEARAAIRLLKRWYAPNSTLEVSPSDIVLRDGTVSPQDRDFYHYGMQTSYGKIVRDMIGINWEIALKCREDDQTIAGVVKMAQLHVFAPVINWFAGQVASKKTSQLISWPMQSMNLIPDQVLLTRLLTAGRKKGESWVRTCVALRPFHATTNYALGYSNRTPPSKRILDDYERAMASPEALDQEKRLFWESFRPESDPYVKMLENVFYGSFFLGSVPRLDIEKNLPRFEFLTPYPTKEEHCNPWPTVYSHLNRLVSALRQTNFQVSGDHRMFQSEAKIDVLPEIIIRAHETVKVWAAELLSRVQEYIGYYMARYVNKKKFRGIRVRPFTRSELELLYSQLKQERNIQAGESNPPEMLEK